MHNSRLLTYKRQLAQIESYTPALLAAHGIFISLQLGGSLTVWLLLTATSMLGVFSLITKQKSKRDFTQWRASLLLLLSTTLIFLTGGPASYFLLWYFVLVSIYPIVLEQPLSRLFPILMAGIYPFSLFFANQHFEPVVVAARSILLLYIGIVTERLSSISTKDIEERDRVIEKASDAIFIADLNGRYIDVNEKGQQLLGYSRDEILQLNLRDLIIPEPNPIPVQLDRLKAGETILSERRLRHRNGTAIDVEISSKMIGEQKLQGIVRDISERKTIERALLEKANQMQQLLDTSLDGYILADERGQIIDVNPSYCSLIGYSRQELIQMNIEDVEQQLSPKEIKDRITTITTHGRAKFETKHKAKNGKVIDLDVSITVLTIENKPLIAAFVRDITQRKQAEAAQAELNQLVEKSLNEIYVFDVKTWRFLQVNAEACRNIGYTLSELRKRTPLDIKPEFNKNTFTQLLNPLITAEKPKLVFVTKHLRKDKTLYDVEVHLQKGTFNGKDVFVAIILDISERKLAEQALRDSELRFRTLAQNAPVGIFETDKNGNCIYVNTRWCELAGISPDQAYGQGWINAIYPEDRENVEKAWAETAAKGTFFNQEYRFQTPEGKISWLTGQAQTLLNERGEIIGHLGTITDISAFKQAQASLIKFREVMDESNDSIFLIDEETGRYLDFNRSAYKSLGYTREELLSLTVYDVAAHIKNLSDWKYRVELIRGQENYLLESQYRRKDGSFYPGEVSAKSLVFNEKPAILAFVRDISERKQTEKTLQKQNDYLAAIQNITVDLLESKNVNALLSTLCEKAATLLSATYGLIYLDDGETLLLRATTQNASLHLNEREQKPGIGVLGQVWQTQNLVVVEHYEAWELRDPNYTSDGLRAIVGIPIKQKNTITGVLIIARTDDDNRTYSAEEMEILSHFSKLASLVLENVSLYESALAEIAEREKIADALLKSEERYRILFEDSPLAIWEEDFSKAKKYIDALKKQENFTDIRTYLNKYPNEIAHIASMVTVVDVNKAVLTLYKAERKEQLFGNLQEILLEETLLSFKEEIIAIANEELTCTWEGIDKAVNGDILNINLRWTVAPDAQADYSRVIVTITDISERKQTEKQIQQQLQRLKALHTIDNSISSSFDVRITLDILLNQIITHLNVDAADVLFFNSATRTLEYALTRGFTINNAESNTALRLGEGPAGRAILERRTIFLPNLIDPNAEFKRINLLQKESFISYLGVPLIAKGKILGVLEIFNRSLLEPSQDWIEFLESLAGQAAIAIDNGRLFQNFQNTNAELTIAYDATIEGWSKAMDLRDNTSDGHTQRVADLTVQLAKACGVSERETIHIRRGALLHDIGKIGMPDGILLKPEPLTNEEWALMKKHPQLAHDMLQPIKHLHQALDIPYCHHEKWDGSGYPRGLTGEQIPMAARVFAVIDVWDALKSDRPFRKGWPENKIIKHIQSLSGTHFDPKVVESFLSMISNQKE